MLSESEAIQRLISARSRIAASAWLLTRDYQAAEDCFQNTVLKAMTKEVSFPSEAALLSWAMVVARREALDWLDRRCRRDKVLDESVLSIMDQQRLAAPSESLRSSALRECIEALGEEGRRLLQLRYFEGLGCEQVAQVMRLSLPAVYKRLSRLHDSLAKCVRGKMMLIDGGV